MDGNGRWAKARHRPRSFGHRAGQKAVRGAIKFCLQRGVEALTLFAFSSENWQRPRAEVGALMELFLKALDREVDELHGYGVRIDFIGELSAFAPALRGRMQAAMDKTQGNAKLALNIAVNYGGRWDIAQAARRAAIAAQRGRIAAESIDEKSLVALFLPRRPAARRPVHPYRRRAPRQQFSVLATRRTASCISATSLVARFRCRLPATPALRGSCRAP